MPRTDFAPPASALAPTAPPVERTTTKTLYVVQLFPNALTMAALLNNITFQPQFSISPDTLTSLSGQVTTGMITAMLNDWKTALTAPTVVLFTNNLSPNRGLAYADLVEPTASWYSEIASALGDAHLLPDGTIGFTGASVAWNYTDTADPSTTVVGWGLIDIVTS